MDETNTNEDFADGILESPTHAHPHPSTHPPPTGFMLPDVLRRESDLRHVTPPREAQNALATMLRDLLTGSLTAGLAALDWLKERSEYESERRVQRSAFERLLKTLFRQAQLRASRADSEDERMRMDSQYRFAELIAGDWQKFCNQVVVIFAFDLFVVDDAMRFVDEVMLPGKMGEFGEGT